MNTILILLMTSMGSITLELYPEQAPVTVENFVQYVEDGHYDDTIFHRVIDGFMIQGGGFTAEMQKRNTRAPINNEAANGLPNTMGSVAMARTGDPHSATAQFFINVGNNSFLNKAESQDGWGYAVFGRVTEGMDVVEKIKLVRTGRNAMGMQDVPVEPITIISATVISNSEEVNTESNTAEAN